MGSGGSMVPRGDTCKNPSWRAPSLHEVADGGGGGPLHPLAVAALGPDDHAQPPDDERLLLRVAELAVQVHEVLGHGVPVALEHPLQELPLFGVPEDGGRHRGVLVAVPLEVRRGVAPVRVGRVVVDHVVVLVPHVVVAIQDGHGIHILVARVVDLHEGVPHVGDAAEDHACLDVGEDPVDEAEGGVPPEEQRRHAVVRDLAREQLLQEEPLLPLHEERDRAEPRPVEREAGRVEEEGERVRAVQVQVRVHVVDVVVPPVVDLHVRHVVVPGDHPIERADPPLVGAVQALERALEEAPVGVPLLVHEGVDVREKLHARAHAADVVDAEGGELQAVLRMLSHGPEEKARDAGAQEEHPRDVGVVARVEQHEAPERPRHAPHHLGDTGAKGGHGSVAPDVPQRRHQRHGHDDLDGEDRRHEGDLRDPPEEGDRVREPAPGEGLPAVVVEPSPEVTSALERLRTGGEAPPGLGDETQSVLEGPRWGGLVGPPLDRRACAPDGCGGLRGRGARRRGASTLAQARGRRSPWGTLGLSNCRLGCHACVPRLHRKERGQLPHGEEEAPVGHRTNQEQHDCTDGEPPLVLGGPDGQQRHPAEGESRDEADHRPLRLGRLGFAGGCRGRQARRHG
mmetsp:Transcript_61332/g.179881  ORF Transcript_61332/g.179881 Transcript_61332/m.179881 type:complete len:626 (-) Transcript_61332:92-1969(-)